jgi:hypothetical protein
MAGLEETNLGGWGSGALAEGEDRIFQRAGAVETAAVLGGGLGEVELESADGVEGFADGIAVLPEALLVFRGVDDDLAGEPWRNALRQARFLPSGVRGPVESFPFSRQAASWAGIMRGSF